MHRVIVGTAIFLAINQGFRNSGQVSVTGRDPGSSPTSAIHWFCGPELQSIHSFIPLSPSFPFLLPPNIWPSKQNVSFKLSSSDWPSCCLHFPTARNTLHPLSLFLYLDIRGIRLVGRGGNCAFWGKSSAVGQPGLPG